MLALVNPRCNYGNGLQTWHRIEPVLRARFGDIKVQNTAPLSTVKRRLAHAIDCGERRIIAAGGDGTVNLVGDSLLSAPNHDGAALGAVALGSSNDFHKPVLAAARLRGIPVRLRWEEARPRDVIRIRYPTPDGTWMHRSCFINAGVGITAHANAIYSGCLPLIRRLQRVSVEAAILASVVHALGTFRAIPCRLSLDDEPLGLLPLTNLAVLKSPHVGGTLCYDTPVGPADGSMRINLCVGMTTTETIRTLLNLYLHRFAGRSKTFSYTARRLSISSDHRFAVEMDGEVVYTRHVSFELRPGALRCCP